MISRRLGGVSLCFLVGEGGEVVQGQPQWRRKVTIVGFAFGFGMGS